MKSPTVVLMITPTQFHALVSLYEQAQKSVNNPSVVFFAQEKNLSVTVYLQEKGYKVVLQGARASEEALLFQPKKIKNFYPHLGSDEVGTGDFLGPIVVASTFVDHDHVERVKALGVKDSKMLEDDTIRKMAQELITFVPYSVNILSNHQFNEWTKKGLNMNAVKAILHHQVLTLLSKKVNQGVPMIVDQFCDLAHFQSYLLPQGLEPLQGIRLVEKAENQFLAVACASIIARYRFLKAMDALNDQWKIKFPLGASKLVETFSENFAKTHGLKVLATLAKTNFSTYQRLIDKLS